MTNLLQLLGDGLFVFAAVGWALEFRQRKLEVREADEDGYDRGWEGCAAHSYRNQMALASVMLEESAGELAGHTIYPQLAPEVLAAEDVPRPGSVCEPTSTGQLAEPDEMGDDTAVREFARFGSWEQQQRSISSAGVSPWFLDWQQRQAVA